MRILILGGTRFFGRRAVEIFEALGHELTLLSRRSVSDLQNVRQICAEKRAGLEVLKGSRFDLVLDFICYDGDGPIEVAENVYFKRYIMISSTWVPRLWNGIAADELHAEFISPISKLPPATVNYLLGKVSAERAVVSLRKAGREAVSLRLPIILGEGDHTGRLDFYCHRFADGGPLIAVAGGKNNAQIALMDDLAKVLVRWIEAVDINRLPIWEGLPGEGRSVQSIVDQMASSLGIKVNLIDVSVAELKKKLPVFLDHEPFWRESALPVTEANIYDAVGIPPAVFSHGLYALTNNTTSANINLRLEELHFLANR
jgi:nucleoside-diphosphate-sugar epimerase